MFLSIPLPCLPDPGEEAGTTPWSVPEVTTEKGQLCLLFGFLATSAHFRSEHERHGRRVASAEAHVRPFSSGSPAPAEVPWARLGDTQPWEHFVVLSICCNLFKGGFCLVATSRIGCPAPDKAPFVATGIVGRGKRALNVVNQFPAYINKFLPGPFQNKT